MEAKAQYAVLMTHVIVSLTLTEMKSRTIRLEIVIIKFYKKFLLIYKDARKSSKMKLVFNKGITRIEFVISKKLYRFFKVILIKQRDK